MVRFVLTKYGPVASHGDLICGQDYSFGTPDMRCIEMPDMRCLGRIDMRCVEGADMSTGFDSVPEG